VLENLEQEIEEAAATLGASRLRTFAQILAPSLFPTILTGFALSFARAVGEYGSITFVSGNLPFKTEIVPQLIVIKIEENNYAAATAIAAVLLVVSFAILALINWLEVWTSRFNK
jgi:sulfate transport system permease protein